MIKRDMISAWRVRGRRVINLLIWGSAVAAMVYWAGWGITACALIILLVYEGSRWGFSRVVCKGAVIKYDWFYKPFIGWFWDDAEGTDNCKGWKRCGSCLAGSAGLLLLAGLTRLELVFGLGKLGNFYIALILVSLLNLIPFPIFDGGRCLISVFSRGTWSGHIAAVLLLSVAFFACWGVNPLHACLSSALSFLLNEHLAPDISPPLHICVHSFTSRFRIA